LIKRTLYFGNEAYLSVHDEQLVVQFPDKERKPAKIAIEDIGVVVLDYFRLTYSQAVMSKLLHNNAAIIICNDKHLPQGMLLNLDGNHVQSERFRIQIEASLPLKKGLWKQTIRTKIANQAYLLSMGDFPVENMLHWAAKVGSGDPENFEGRAAAHYWKHIFSEDFNAFVRGRDEDEPNGLLNYGYAILRAVVARSIVGSGMLPTLGIHHRNKYNAYCLADDLMEPYRPFVDQVVLQIVAEQSDFAEMNQENKKRLLQIPLLDVVIDGQKSPLMLATQQTTSSLFECFAGTRRTIKYPSFA
jgi:CRISPR-associated protein Cas1